MAIPYSKRFNGQTAEIIEYAQNFGIFRAQSIYAPDGDYLCFKKFLVEASGNPNIGLNPKVSGSSIEELSDHIVAALVRKLTKQQQEITDLRKQLEVERLDTARRHNELKLQSRELIRIVE